MKAEDLPKFIPISQHRHLNITDETPNIREITSNTINNIRSTIKKNNQ